MTRILDAAAFCIVAEALTESFCERMRNADESSRGYAAAQPNNMRKTRGLISGLKTHHEPGRPRRCRRRRDAQAEEESLASQQLEAFHESFNFCIICRQYTCLNCWNDDAGRCRTWRPDRRH